MAFFLAPRFAPAYQQSHCNSWGSCGSTSRPVHPFRVSRPHPRRQAYSPFSHFFSQVDELIQQISAEEQRQAQLEERRKRAPKAQFTISPNEDGWTVDGEFYGFKQHHLSLEVMDDNTLKITGDTRQEVPAHAQAEEQQQKAIEEPKIGNIDSASLSEPEQMTETTLDEQEDDYVHAEDPSSDTASTKSYQATVEDDFEDLGAETSSTISVQHEPKSATALAPAEPKGKEKAVESPIEAEASAQIKVAPVEQPKEQEQPHAFFERTFRFPLRIDVNNVHAKFEEGKLKIVIHRAKPQGVRSISIV